MLYLILPESDITTLSAIKNNILQSKSANETGFWTVFQEPVSNNFNNILKTFIKIIFLIL